MLTTFKALKTLPVMAVAVGAWVAMSALPVYAAQDAAQVKKGQEVYTAQKCSLCHTIAGKGKGTTLDGVGGKLSADDIKQWITHPTDAAKKANSTKKPPMPAKYGKLPAADIDALVAYMQSLK